MKVAQLGGACERQHPPKGAHPSRPRPKAVTAPFLCPRPRLSSTKPPGAAWRAKIRKKKSMAWIEQKSLLLSSLSHYLLRGLGQPPGRLLFKLEALNFTLLVDFLLLSFLPSKDTRVHGRLGIPLGPCSKLVYSSHLQVLLPRAINTSMAVLKEQKGSASCLLFDFLPPCSGRCGC